MKSVSRQPLHRRPMFRIAITVAGVLLLAWSASAAPVDTSDPISVFWQFLTNVSKIAGRMAEAFAGKTGMEILAGCAMIRILMIVLPGVIDGDLSKLASEGVSIAMTVTIVLALMANWTSGFNIVHRVWGATGSLAQTVIDATQFNARAPTIPIGADPLPAIGKWVAESAIKNIQNASSAIALFFNIPGDAGAVGKVMAMITGNYGLSLLVIFSILVVAVVTGFVYASMFIQIVLSWAHIVIVLAFGPLVLAFYPLKPDWGKALVKEVATGMITLACVVFLLSVANFSVGQAGQVITNAGQAFVTG